jgi:hypothetical protein
MNASEEAARLLAGVGSRLPPRFGWGPRRSAGPMAGLGTLIGPPAGLATVTGPGRSREGPLHFGDAAVRLASEARLLSHTSHGRP